MKTTYRLIEHNSTIELQASDNHFASCRAVPCSWVEKGVLRALAVHTDDYSIRIIQEACEEIDRRQVKQTAA